MGDDDGRARGHEARQRVHQSPLGLDVQVRRRLVEHQDGGGLEHGARDGQPLALTATEQHAVLTDPGRVSRRQRFDEVVHLGDAAGFDHLLVGGERVAQREVVADGRVEQVDVLRHHAQHRPDLIGRGAADIQPADGDGADLELPEAEQQLYEGGLAGATRPDDTQAATLRDRQLQVLQDQGQVRCIPEVEAADHDVVGSRRRQRLGRLGDRRGCIDELEQARASRRGRVIELHGLHQGLDRLEAGDRGKRHQGEVDAVEPAAGDEWDRDAQQGDTREAGQEGAQPRAKTPHDGQPLPDPVQLLAQVERRLSVPLGLIERDQVGDALDLVHEDGIELAADRHQVPRWLAPDPARAEWQRDAGEHQEDHQHRAEQRIEHTQQQRRECGHEDCDQRRHDDPHVEVLEAVDICGDATQQVAAAMVLQAGWSQWLDRGKEPDPQIRQDPERRPVGHDALEIPEGGPRDRQDADRGDGKRDIRDVADEGRATDEPRGDCHQADARPDGQESQ